MPRLKEPTDMREARTLMKNFMKDFGDKISNNVKLDFSIMFMRLQSQDPTGKLCLDFMVEAYNRLSTTKIKATYF